MKMIRALLCLVVALAVMPADARIKRSQSAKIEFKLEHPCPANGAHKGPCKGYVIDHIKPLACGGADAPSNMQWQTVGDAKAKDKWERKGGCVRE
jgi:hypothetical protein